MKPELPETIYSPQDLQAVIQEVKTYANWLLHSNVKKQVAGADDSVQPTVSEATKALLTNWSAEEALTPKSLEKRLTELEAFADRAPSLAITLAAPPAGGLKKELVSWFRSNVDPGLLVSFDFNATILGGMVVRYNSRIFDWSFRQQLLANREHFPEVLRRV